MKKRRVRHKPKRRPPDVYAVHKAYRWNIRTHENQQPKVLDLMISPRCKGLLPVIPKSHVHT